MLQMTDLSIPNRDFLPYEISRLCSLVNGTFYAPDWEYELWGAVMGLHRIPDVDFGVMNKLLFHARSSNVWVSHNVKGYYFVPMHTWLEQVRARKEKTA